jgi:hypothetical protein
VTPSERTAIIAALPVGITSTRSELRDFATANGIAFEPSDSWNVILRKIEEAMIARAQVALEAAHA